METWDSLCGWEQEGPEALGIGMSHPIGANHELWAPSCQNPTCTHPLNLFLWKYRDVTKKFNKVDCDVGWILEEKQNKPSVCVMYPCTRIPAHICVLQPVRAVEVSQLWPTLRDEVRCALRAPESVISRERKAGSQQLLMNNVQHITVLMCSLGMCLR